jgi:hypothetical protein
MLENRRIMICAKSESEASEVDVKEGLYNSPSGQGTK